MNKAKKIDTEQQGTVTTYRCFYNEMEATNATHLPIHDLVRKLMEAYNYNSLGRMEFTENVFSIICRPLITDYETILKTIQETILDDIFCVCNWHRVDLHMDTKNNYIQIIGYKRL